jgi:hypothetical protein
MLSAKVLGPKFNIKNNGPAELDFKPEIIEIQN